LTVNLISRADINLENGDIISIKASRCEKTSHSVASWFINNSVGLLVHHPDTLISSTAVVGSLFCPRRGVLSEWFRGIDGDSTIMVIGSLVHELLQEVIHIFYVVYCVVSYVLCLMYVNTVAAQNLLFHCITVVMRNHEGIWCVCDTVSDFQYWDDCTLFYDISISQFSRVMVEQ
jgi:hypothetical protein